MFGPEWSFIGLGALSNLEPIHLGRRHELVLKQKMTEAEYHAFIDTLDIGISMMFAPHPSVVPFEFATTGSLVITNVFENRSAAELQAISRNILPCELSVDDLARAMTDAVAAVEEYRLREERAYRPPATSWGEIFSPEFISRLRKKGLPNPALI